MGAPSHPPSSIRHWDILVLPVLLLVWSSSLSNKFIVLILHLPVYELVNVFQLDSAVLLYGVLILPHDGFLLLDICECLSHKGTQWEEKFGGLIQKLAEHDHVNMLALLRESANKLLVPLDLEFFSRWSQIWLLGKDYLLLKVLNDVLLLIDDLINQLVYLPFWDHLVLLSSFFLVQLD